MSRIYKICVLNQSNENANEVFAIKPYLESFDSFKDEIYIRMPELKNQPLKMYYQDSDGDNITIFNALDFGIFQEQKISKVFVVKNGLVKSVSFQSNQSIASVAPAAPTAPTAPTESTSSAPNPQLLLHANVICDGCDKEIYGYRYKCLECADYDLCNECQPKLHNHHLMIRIADPSDAEICYKSKLGKRFLRHRRSESLCAKMEEREKKHHGHHHHPHPHPHPPPHHKRHASSASGVRPPTVSDVIATVLSSFAGTNNSPCSNGQPSTNTESTNTQSTNTKTTAGESQPKKPSTSTKSTSTTTTTSTSTPTPTSAPSYGFNVGNAPGKPQLKQGMDMLSHVAHNFAAMMDPFATFMEQSANAYASAASDAAASATAASATASSQTKKAKKVTDTQPTPRIEERVIVTTVDADKESAMDKQGQNEESTADKQVQKSQEDIMIVDCSDDEDEDEDEADLRKLVTALNRNSIEATTSTENKQDERSGSIEGEKGSPSREWTFIDSNEIAESAGTSASSTGAIPKKTTPPPVDNSGASNKVDYAELSRLLSTHIDTQQKQAEPTAPPQSDDKAQPEVTENAAKSTKTPPPTPSHPDARVNEALNAMMAMGFSNEGGWLTQLLETVDGSISNALDLLQPHK